MTNNTSRRGFLHWVLGGGAVAVLGSILYPVSKFVMPPASTEENVSQLKLPFKLDELSADESKFRIFKFGRDLGIAVMTPDNEVKAFSAMCTHLSCILA